MTLRHRVLAAVGGDALVGAGVWMTYRAAPAPGPTVRVPQLSAEARAGQLGCQGRCAACHGELAHYYRTEHLRKPSCFSEARAEGTVAP